MNDHSKYHVAAGSFIVSAAKPMILQAFLGTCVGVAVFDAENGIGGLMHLLLPEPASGQLPEFPEKYASTGLPLFLEELREAGAVLGNLKAAIAGGALVGPVRKQDLDLDIGGRTAEVSLAILKNEGIAIETAETGGFFTCCLSLDLSDWTYAIEPAGQDRNADPPNLTPPAPEEINRVLDTIQPIPQVALKVLRMINSESSDLRDIARVVREDQVLTARTLRLCNSAMYSRGKRIDSLEEALILIGENLFVQLVISAAVKDFYNQCGLGYSLSKGGVFQHAVGTALIAEKLARVTGRAKPGSAYTAGLLHDIGKVVLDQYMARAYPYFYRQVQTGAENFLSLEEKIFGINHTRVGKRLAETWAFPDSLTAVIRYHHHPRTSDDFRNLTCIVSLADLLMSRFHTGLELERLNTYDMAEWIADIGLSAENFADIVDLIPQKVFAGSLKFDGDQDAGPGGF